MTSRDSFIVFGQPCICEREVEAVAQVLRSLWIGTGPKCQAFEETFAKFKGVGDALTVSSCTAAMRLALEQLGVGPGDEVVTTPITFAATANVIEHVGARPVFVDVDRRTGNMDVSQVESKFSDRTKAVMAVHLAGRPIDFGALRELCRRRGISIVEDCAHGIEGKWQGQPLGTLGDVGCFSFYATKNITTGEGGMLISRHPEFVQKCRRSSKHGLSDDAWKRFSTPGHKHFLVDEPGHNFRLTDIQAAIGLVQFEKLAGHFERRQELWRYYMDALADLPLELPRETASGDTHARHLFSPLLRLEEAGITRDELLDQLHEAGVGTGVHFVSLHLHPYYQSKYGYQPDDFPNAHYVSQRTFSLPLSGCLAMAQAERVVVALQGILRRS